ncbi:MAG: S8 family serine peptidase [Pseudobdellovibrionaceae bacterium]
MGKKIFLIVGVLVAIGGFYFFFQKEPKLRTFAPLINSNPIQAESIKRTVATGSQKSNQPKRRENVILMKVKEDATPEQLEALQTLSQELDLKNEKKLLDGKAVRMRFSKKKNSEQTEEEVAGLIQATGAVEYVEPDYHVPPAFVPNDFYYPYEWHHPLIKSDVAWNYTQGSVNTIVAVCDAGFDLTHPELASRVLLPAYNTVLDNGTITDLNDHGTNTTGVLAAAGNNTQGVAGMAWKVRILPIQISNQADGVSTYSDVAECIIHAKNRGAKVVNISYDSIYTSAIVSDAALAERSAGGLVVVAAGNSTFDISGWGESPNLIVVGATDQYDKMTWFSNFGTPVDLFAPGQDIYTTAAGNSYALVAGTSFSTPVVAGTAALIYSLNPTLNAAQVENLILSKLSNVGLSKGRLNVGAAVQAAVPPGLSTITLDNLAANVSDSSRISKGKWCKSNLSGSYGNMAVYSCGPYLETYRFVPTITKEMNYKISIRYLSNSSMAQRAPVTIKFSTGSMNKIINMQSGGGTWVSLGTFTLKAGTASYVEFSDSAGRVTVDGVRFEPVVSAITTAAVSSTK